MSFKDRYASNRFDLSNQKSQRPMRKIVLFLMCISLLIIEANAAQPPGKASVTFNDEVLFDQASMTIQDQDFCNDVSATMFSQCYKLFLVTSYETEADIQQTAVSYLNFQTDDNIFVSAGGMANWQIMADGVIKSKETELQNNLNLLNCNLKFPLLE